MKKKTYKQLENEIKELKASTPYAYKFFNDELKKLSRDNLMGSGVLVSFTVNYKSGPKTNDIMFKDGLSEKTIDAIKEDLKYCCDISTMFKL